MKVKGIYKHRVVELLEAVDLPDGTEVEVILPAEESPLTSVQRDILQKTKGMWAGNERIDEALDCLNKGWDAWQIGAS